MVQVGDVGCAVHLCSLLHQRYAEFSPALLEQLQKIYSTEISKDEDKVRCMYIRERERERERERGREETI